MTASTSIVATVAQRTWIRATALAVLLLVVLVPATPATAAPAASAASAGRALQVSFDAQAEVRLRGQRFVGAAQARVDAANDVLAHHPGVLVERVFGASEAQLDADRARLQRAGRRNVPDLNRHYRIVAADAAERDRLVQAMARVAVVDEAIAEPQPTPPPATGNYVAQQRYAATAPAGVDVAALAQFPGGRGEQTKIVDVEYSWNRAHEDLAKAAAPGTLIANGTAKDPFLDTNHGTAVLGALIGTDNAFGITGLAPGSQIAMVNAVESSPCNCWALAQAIYIAAQNMTPGDVMLVEQQVQGAGQPGDYVAAEYWAPVYDAISFATQSGVVVVEAAGNGMTSGQNLDAAAYGSPFPQGKPDSGAIIAGAGTGQCSLPANARFAKSAFGARVNLQGWGQCVTTAGYGVLFDGGPNARYTDAFSGTSSASAIVAGAAALYSSVYQATHEGAAPTPAFVRDRLIATGTPQANPGDGHIGPLPNLAAAASDFPPMVTITAGPSGPTTDPAPTFAFTASEAPVSFTCRLDDAAGFTPCSSPFTLPAQAVGPHTLRVRATDSDGDTGPIASRTFSVEQLPPPPVPPVPAPSDPAPIPAPDLGFTGSGDPVTPPPPPARAPTIGPGAAMTVRVATTGAVRLARPTITCPANGQACSVAVSVRRTGAGNASLGKATLSVQPGRTATIRFTLTRAARALLKRKGTLKATARIAARQAGLTSTRTLLLTLKRR